MVINNEFIDAVFYCKYKAYLKKNMQSSKKSDFAIVFNQLKEKQKSIVSIKQIAFKNNEFDLIIDGISKDEKGNIIPIYISPFEKLQKFDKLRIALVAYYIKQNFNQKIEKAEIIFGMKQKRTKVILSKYFKELKRIIIIIEQIEQSAVPPAFYKNAHCQFCEFDLICDKKLRERDDLSLLGTIKLKEMEQKNNRGIFSVKQLSYIFRPNKNPYRKRKYLPELKALAIRERKVFIQKLPELKQNEIEIFFDIEGIPDRNFYYLIGIIIKKENLEMEYSFWANKDNQQQDIFIQFIDLLDSLNDFVLYHYGSYEIHALKQISKRLSKPYQDKIKYILEKSQNILTIISNDIYVPTYTNGLKDIANYLGFYWSNVKASGVQSIIWRYNWEMNPTFETKNAVVAYNIDDCKALIKVKNWLFSITENNDKAVLVNTIKQQNIYKWGVTVFALEHFNEINAKAYFDYQRQHIFLRTERKVYKAISKNKQSEKQYNKIDKVVKIIPSKCNFCNSNELSIVKSTKKVQVDLAFMKSGLKKQVIEYNGGAYRCKNCKKIFFVENMKTLPKYGKNLMLWSVNQKIQYKLSSESIINLLRDSFKINVSNTQMTRFKEIIAVKYSDTYGEIIKKMCESNLMHIDETIARIEGINGYVWVFANYNSVYYQFRETRESVFLKDLLKDFRGVLVSDFYTGYDSIECKQQKCLVHLIRDLNEDFMKNQLDEEFKQIISEFGNILRNIIMTIDKYGLKQVHLNKHVSEVEKFYTDVILKDFESELAITYKKRFIKYKEKLFTFMSHDSIPWNNNNAEYSIKPFAKWRKKVSKSLNRNNIENHLILLSMLQTCKYQGVNFFDFLKSGKKSIFE